MALNPRKATIIMAEDDEEDRLLIKEALEEAGIDLHVECAQNGEELLDLLYRYHSDYEKWVASPPAFILLDLNMPKMDGRKTLEIMRKNDYLKKIPVIVFTTSDAKEDITFSYIYGANSYIRKPSSYISLVDIMKTLKSYWLETVSLPVKI